MNDFFELFRNLRGLRGGLRSKILMNLSSFAPSEGLFSLEKIRGHGVTEGRIPTKKNATQIMRVSKPPTVIPTHSCFYMYFCGVCFDLCFISSSFHQTLLEEKGNMRCESKKCLSGTHATSLSPWNNVSVIDSCYVYQCFF